MSVIGILGKIRDDLAAEKTGRRNPSLDSSGDEGNAALR
jgi:hypothetical protein